MSDLQWLFDAIRALGVAGGPVFAIIWWLERAERRASQKDNRDLLVQVLTVTSQVTNSITAVTTAVAEAGKNTRDTANSLNQLGQLIRQLSVILGKKRDGG